MIITLKGADFSGNNIGTLDSWSIIRTLGDGATYSGVSFVNKGASYSGTVTIADGYELNGDVVVTMGGTEVSGAVTVSGNTITISIASVTGNVRITVNTTSTGEAETWYDLPVDTYSLGVTSSGTGRVSNTATRFSTANPTTPNGILVKSGETITIKGLRSGTYPLRFDYIYGTVNAVNPPSGSTTQIEGLVGTASNYDSDNYFPCNADGSSDTYDVENSFGGDYYFWFGFAGVNKTEGIQAEIGTYTLQYKIQ